jgi:putative endonuclease
MLSFFQGWFAPANGTNVKDPLGDRGENLASRYLRERGYRILIRNFRCPLGEIDIVARDGRTLVFVEVKTRAEDDPLPEDQVNGFKRHQITKAAKYYLGRYGTPQPPSRFDVIAVVWPDGKEPQVRHTQHAFEATF